MPLSKFVNTINTKLSGIIPGIKVYGIAEPVTRGTEVIPGVIGNDGEITYVGINDDPVIIYHKANAMATRLSTVSKGVGDGQNSTVNAYSMSMIVYIDRKRLKMRPDDLFLYLQANIPFEIKEENYRQVLTQINTVILNSQAVYDSEYKGVANRLPANHSLMQINYTIEGTFRKDCFEKCPEVC